MAPHRLKSINSFISIIRCTHFLWGGELNHIRLSGVQGEPCTKKRRYEEFVRKNDVIEMRHCQVKSN
ncbi:MAG TPA: hypothetical protein ENG03_03320 [Thioploca sp.]|nr:MAG: hypothetical protein DRR19_04680 [Gammaproteobacteria bacterium]HDN26122.1 hypothetical protein [Thioploca sp.]